MSGGVHDLMASPRKKDGRIFRPEICWRSFLSRSASAAEWMRRLLNSRLVDTLCACEFPEGLTFRIEKQTTY